MAEIEVTEVKTAPTEIEFWKVQAIGNHFPLVHLDELALDPLAVEANTKTLGDLAIAMCTPHFSIGGDGLLAVAMEEGDVRLRMFNPDGTEDFCGNGIRCAAHHVHTLGWVGESFNIRHLDRVVPVTINGAEIRTEIGIASYKPEDVPTNIAGEIFNETVFARRDGDWPVILTGSALSTGSTHVVIPTGNLPDDEGFRSVSAQLEHDSRFPQRTSVIWAARAGDALKIRIWERGVGETLGCGTGSSAAAVNFMRLRNKGGRVEVINPGGTVWVEAQNWYSPITLVGSAETLFEGTFAYPVVS